METSHQGLSRGMIAGSAGLMEILFVVDFIQELKMISCHLCVETDMCSS